MTADEASLVVQIVKNLPAMQEWKEVLVALSCSTLCDHTGCSPPSSSVHGILQARILEWVAIPFSRGSSDLRMEPRSLAHYRQIFYCWATRKPMQCETSIPGLGRSPGEGNWCSDNDRNWTICCRIWNEMKTKIINILVWFWKCHVKKSKCTS